LSKTKTLVMKDQISDIPSILHSVEILLVVLIFFSLIIEIADIKKF